MSIEDRRCEMIIRSTGVLDHWNWESFYNEGVLVAGMCVRAGKRGAAFRLGEFMLLTAEREFQLINRVGTHHQMSLEFRSLLDTNLTIS